MKFLILFLWFLPGTALAQRDYCKQIEKDKPDIKAEGIQSESFEPSQEEQEVIKQQLIKESASQRRNLEIE